MELSPLRIGVVGFGYWGPNIVRSLNKLDGSTVVIACDLSEANLARFSALYPEVETTTDLERLLSAELALDAIVVASAAPSHFAIAKRVIDSGKHCFVEKPLALKVDDAKELVRLSAQAGTVLMVGHLMEYHSAINWIKECIASGELGDVLYLYMQRLNLGKVRTEENAFWSLAPHDVSIALYLLGEAPSAVSACGAAYVTEDVEDTVFANLRFASGKMVNIHVSWLDPHKVRTLTVVGTEKMLVFDDMQSTEKIWVYDRGLGEPHAAMTYGEDLTLRFGDIKVPWVPLKEPLLIEMQHFLECCVTGSTPRSDGHDGLRVVSVLDAVDRSLALGGSPVAVDCEV